MEARIGDLLLLKNNQFLAFNKKPGIPVQADKKNDLDFLSMAQFYSKRTLFLCNRIDRPASGIVLFARNKKAAANISEQFKNRKIKKTYLGIVAKPIRSNKEELRNHLKKIQNLNKSFVLDKAERGSKEAISIYEKLAESERYVLLKIDIESGRHHQIRAQLAHIGSPIKGDVKYGFRRSNKDKSIHLHGWKMELLHPVSNDKIKIVADPPEDALWDHFRNAI